MSDRTFREVAPDFDAWLQRDEYIEELIAENHQQHTELQELTRENASLRIRLARALESERQLREYRQRSIWGAGVALWDRLLGRM